MFKRFHIENFKSLKEFDIQLSMMSALVGDTSSGFHVQISSGRF